MPDMDSVKSILVELSSCQLPIHYLDPRVDMYASVFVLSVTVALMCSLLILSTAIYLLNSRVPDQLFCCQAAGLASFASHFTCPLWVVAKITF